VRQYGLRSKPVDELAHGNGEVFQMHAGTLICYLEMKVCGLDDASEAKRPAKFFRTRFAVLLERREAMRRSVATIQGRSVGDMNKYGFAVTRQTSAQSQHFVVRMSNNNQRPRKARLIADTRGYGSQDRFRATHLLPFGLTL
jgi:hypothetical protein